MKSFAGAKNSGTDPVRTLRVSHPVFGAPRSLEDFWALRHLNFEVRRGEVIGIVGSNGAGKSTLLKILSRITEPTEGRVRIRGRVASLLEVGTGFHPELTGRENIFLNGAILGMSRAEIKRKFEEIVAFAEVEKFLDTPVKHYSSGMYVRLAFAVAAHLEPEVLIVDEVLAVGDTEFQKKCLGKMESVSRSEGRTVLFVSHNMTAVQALCGKLAYLSDGQLAGFGPTEELMARYLHDIKQKEATARRGPAKVGGALEVRKLSVWPSAIVSGQDLRFSIDFFSPAGVTIDDIAILLFSSNGVRVSIIDLRGHEQTSYVSRGSSRLEGTICSVPLVEGEFQIGLFVRAGDASMDIMGLSSFTVTGKSRPDGPVPYAPRYRGFIELDYRLEDVGSACPPNSTVPLP
jgi:lipopolysaccharide transport system ATP-binding protein